MIVLNQGLVTTEMNTSGLGGPEPGARFQPGCAPSEPPGDSLCPCFSSSWRLQATPGLTPGPPVSLDLGLPWMILDDLISRHLTQTLSHNKVTFPFSGGRDVDKIFRGAHCKVCLVQT